ncbi:MAG: hypothetical protein Q4P36_01285 [Bowdeniella nasicola]|nr:hypothetical protein [Bowdeniella nasicola]
MTPTPVHARRPGRPLARVAVTCAAAALALSGCGGGDGDAPDTEDSSAPAAEASETPAPDAAAEGESGAPSPDASAPGGEGDDVDPEWADSFAMPPLESEGFPETATSRTIEDLRTGEHEDFTRLVVEFSPDQSGSGEGLDALPAYSLDYVEEAITDAKGDALPVASDVVLDIRLSGVAYPEGADSYPFTGVRTTGAIKEAIPVGPFEGMSQIALGLDKEHEVRVFELRQPARLVIDLAH